MESRRCSLSAACVLILVNLTLVVDLTSCSALEAAWAFLGKEKDLPRCNFHVSSTLVPSSSGGLSNLSDRLLLGLGRGLTVLDVDHLVASATSGGQLRSFFPQAECNVLVDDGSNVSRSRDLLHRVRAVSKVLVSVIDDIHGFLDALDSALNESGKIWSFDQVLIDSSGMEKPQVLCQGVGNISATLGKSLSACRDLDNLRAVLRRSRVQVSLGLRKPYDYVGKDGHFVGADIQLLDMLRRGLGFEFIFRVESNYGMQRLPNGTNVGFIASLTARESEVGLGEMQASSDRLKYVDFSTPTYFNEIGFATPLPKPISAYFTLLNPMDRTTWLATLASLLAVAAVFVAVDLLFGTLDASSSLFADLALPYSVMMQYNAPHQWFDRPLQARLCVICAWIFAAFFISMGYKSVLLAKLTFQEYERPIDTPEDVLRSGLTVVVPQLTAMQFLIRDSPLQVYKDIYASLVLGRNGLIDYSGIYPKWVDCLVYEGRAVLANDVLTVDRSKLHVAQTRILSQSTHLIHPHNSRFRLLSDRIVRQVKAMGLLNKFLDMYLGSIPTAGYKASQDNGMSNEQRAISVDVFLPILLIVAAGWIWALMAFLLLEMPASIRKSKKKYRDDYDGRLWINKM